MLAALIAAALGVPLGYLARRELAAGRWRRPTDDKPIPAFHWVLVVMPVVLGLVGWRVGEISNWAVPAYAVLACVGVVLAAVDGDVHRLPDSLTLYAAPVIAALLVVASAAMHDWSRLRIALICALAGLVLFFLLAVVVPSGLGLGDVKLAGLLGLATGWLSWGATLTWVFYGFLFGGLWALGLVITRRASRKSHIAFGPSLLLGALVAVLGAASL